MSAICPKCTFLRTDLPDLTWNRQQHIHLTTCGEMPKCWNQRCYITLKADPRATILAETLKHCKFCRVAQYCDSICYEIDRPIHKRECRQLKKGSFYQRLRNHDIAETDKKETFKKEKLFQAQRMNEGPENLALICELEGLVERLVAVEERSYAIIGKLEDNMWTNVNCLNAIGEKYLLLKACRMKYWELAILNSDIMDKQEACDDLVGFLKEYSDFFCLVRFLTGKDDISQIAESIEFINADGNVIPPEEKPCMNRTSLFKNLDIFYSQVELRKAHFFKSIGITSVVSNLDEAIFQNYLLQIKRRLDKIVAATQKNDL